MRISIQTAVICANLLRIETSYTFASYKVYKELERILQERKSALSPRKAIEIAMSIIEVEIITPTSKEKIKKLIMHSEEQKQLIALLGF